METEEKPAEIAENPTPPPEVRWLSQKDCERELNARGDPVTQQVLSRYLARYPEIPRRDHGRRQPMEVDFDALAEHRAKNFQVLEHAARETPPSAAAAAPNDGGAVDDAADLRMRERRAKAEAAEFDLAKARGELIPRAAVLRAIQAAGVELDQAQRTTLMPRAEAVALLKDTRAIAALMQKHDDDVRLRFATALAKLADAGDDEESAQAAQQPHAGGDDLGDGDEGRATE